MNEDLLNVMGSFSETALDCIEKQNEEIEKLQQENQSLKKKYENAVADYEYEHYKNQKAIEYINRKDICIDIRDNKLNYISINDLLEILKRDK